MECDVCSRVNTSQLPFYCTTCARNVLYEPRIDHARVLVEKEYTSSRIAQATNKTRESKDLSDDPRLSSRYVVELATTEKIQADQRVDDISTHMRILREEIKSAKQEISARKTALASRQRTIQSVQQAVSPERSRVLEGIQTQTARKTQAWSSVHERMQKDRGHLCREVANLYGLTAKRTIRKGIASQQYSIGGIAIPDLRDINNVRPDEFSAAIANVAHLLVLTSHYLSLRLPAEINVPHRGHPRPTIFTTSGSYSQNSGLLTMNKPTTSASSSPSSGGDHKVLPRPRPLFIEKRLPQLAQEDPTAYALFIEGISLLAWNLAWLSRSQGRLSGTETWEEVCCMGRNLWHLFGFADSAMVKGRNRPGRGLASPPLAVGSNGGPQVPRFPSSTRLGEYSHGSAHSFLSGSEGLDILRGWKLARYASIADPLKRTLLGEMSNAEWELLEENEWDDGNGGLDGTETVLISARDDQLPSTVDDARSVKTATATRNVLQDSKEPEEEEQDVPRIKGTSGWTKLKPRHKE